MSKKSVPKKWSKRKCPLKVTQKLSKRVSQKCVPIFQRLNSIRWGGIWLKSHPTETSVGSKTFLCRGINGLNLLRCQIGLVCRKLFIVDIFIVKETIYLCIWHIEIKYLSGLRGIIEHLMMLIRKQIQQNKGIVQIFSCGPCLGTAPSVGNFIQQAHWEC